MAATLLAARNCTTLPAGRGLPRAASTPHASFTRRRCCPTARCWWPGDYNSGYLSSAELYDPASGMWTATGNLSTARYAHTATLLPNGKVLVAAGEDTNGVFLAARNCTTRPAGRGVPRAASTPDALITRRRCCPTARCWWQGDITASILRSAELYDPASGTWSATGSLTTARYDHTATLLPNGKVLVAGGYNGGPLSSAELYDIGLGFMRPDWQPQITTATSPLVLGSSLMLTGSRFQGISQASGGNCPGLVNELSRSPTARHRQQPGRLSPGGSNSRLV